MSATLPPARPRPAHAPALPGRNMFSLTLHVSDVPRSVAFYGAVFDREPTKDYPEYAEFAVPEMRFAVGLMHVHRHPSMPVNRFGVRFADATDLRAAVDRLERAGVPVSRVGASGARVTDPDGHRVDLSVATADAPLPDVPTVPVPVTGGGAVWEHRAGSPVPDVIPHADASLDEVTLQATFNTDLAPGALAGLLSEVCRVLKPGGRVLVTGLVGDREAAAVDLPGLASRIKRLPVEHAPMTALATAGFTELHYELFGDIICFQVPGIDMRKIRLAGTKPDRAASGESVAVFYRGPLAEIETDEGVAFRRGVPALISADQWRRLRAGVAGRRFGLDSDGE